MHVSLENRKWLIGDLNSVNAMLDERAGEAKLWPKEMSAGVRGAEEIAQKSFQPRFCEATLLAAAVIAVILEQKLIAASLWNP